MTSTSNSNIQNRMDDKEWRRPLLLSVLCIFSWIYYGIMASVFLLALFYSGWITEVINQYIPDGSWSTAEVSLLFLGLFLLHGVAFAGILLLWKGRYIGYYLFSVPTILITLFHLIRPEISWLTTAVYALLVVLFGVFYRNMRATHIIDK
ncbi:MAG: hypothetical protein IH596_14000 [Bacteroidales bacterium]|nr:hypothetical protein [Bacteroidales bacterium]